VASAFHGEVVVTTETVQYERRGAIAVIILNRPEVRNAQNSALLYALDDAFVRFAGDDAAVVAVLGGAGSCFSSGHDLGTSDVDYDMSFPRRSLWWDHVGKEGVENRLAREEEVYLGLCRRWRDIPKPTIAMVQGACIGGGLMLAWSCDLIVASEDAYFSDPVEDAMGRRVGGDAAFALHQLAHAHYAETTGSPMLGVDPARIQQDRSSLRGGHP